MTRRSKVLRRKSEQRSPKKKFVLFSEGKNTEPEYFRMLQSAVPGSIVTIEIIAAAGSPVTLTNKAAERAKLQKKNGARSSFEKNDEIWAIFDRDDHPNVNEAFEKCNVNDIGIAFSDPCFELWLILHIEDYDKPDDRHQLQKHLQNICPSYSKRGSKTLDFEEILKNLSDAEKRARVQFQRRVEEGETPCRPYSLVFRLTEKIVAANSKYQSTD